MIHTQVLAASPYAFIMMGTSLRVCVCVQDSPLFPVFLHHGPCDWNMLPRMGVRVDRIVWDPAHNRGYCTNLCTRKSTVDRNHTFWNDDLRDGRRRGAEYYCPRGWYRFAIQPPSSVASVCFSDPWKVLYHGTRADVVHDIIEYVRARGGKGTVLWEEKKVMQWNGSCPVARLWRRSGFKMQTCQHGESLAYFSPSIIYCAHPRCGSVGERECRRPCRAGLCTPSIVDSQSHHCLRLLQIRSSVLHHCSGAFVLLSSRPRGSRRFYRKGLQVSRDHGGRGALRYRPAVPWKRKH